MRPSNGRCPSLVSPCHHGGKCGTLGASFGVMVGLCLLPGWELPILTLVACTILGLADRCLCGARDLFVESWEGV